MIPPSDTSGPASSYYPARHAALTAESQTLATRARHLRLVLFGLVALALLLLLAAVLWSVPARAALLPFLAALTLVPPFLRARRQHDQLERLLHLYNRALGRLDGTQPQSGHTGEDFRSAIHLYDRDLVILGPDSLFGLLATVRTGIGQRRLSADLLAPHTRDEILERQRAIQELAPRNDLREQMHLLGASDLQQVPAAFFDTWLDTPPPAFHPALRISLFCITAAYLLLTLLGILHVAAWSTLRPNIFGLLALQSVITLSVRKRVVPVLDASSNLSNQMEMFRDGLAILQDNTFQSPRLVALQALSREPGNAVPLIARIQRQFFVVEQRTENIYLVLSLFLSIGTHAAISIAAWKRSHAASMKQWLTVWAEFESLSALATYAYEHPQNTYPEILPADTAAVFEATNLAHPLLPADAVANNISLNAEQSLYLISGSNMAGKSTLLRAIGSNAVLAVAGAPIRATAPRISPLHIGASISITDSLAEGKSKFLAEVERLHAILKSSDEGPLLFLIDEIFSGTNSLDRRIAAEAVARSLTARNAIGALSTHDLTLTEMAANPNLRAVNVHMGSPNPADPLAFDYRLKPGVNPTTNALAILALIGIDVE